MSMIDKIRKKQKAASAEFPDAIPASKLNAEPKMRKCCESQKGKGPHLPGCRTLLPPKPKKKRYGAPDGWRWPVSVDMQKRWSGSVWTCAVSTEDGFSISATHSGSIGAEWKCALAYLKWLDERPEESV